MIWGIPTWVLYVTIAGAVIFTIVTVLLVLYLCPSEKLCPNAYNSKVEKDIIRGETEETTAEDEVVDEVVEEIPIENITDGTVVIIPDATTTDTAETTEPTVDNTTTDEPTVQYSTRQSYSFFS